MIVTEQRGYLAQLSGEKKVVRGGGLEPPRP